jgi:hypothetical protein
MDRSLKAGTGEFGLVVASFLQEKCKMKQHEIRRGIFFITKLLMVSLKRKSHIQEHKQHYNSMEIFHGHELNVCDD